MEWKDWKAGDKLVFVGAPDMQRIGTTVMQVDAVYTAAQIIPVEEGETLVIGGRMVRCKYATALVVVAEVPTEYTQATLFKKLEKKPEHRGMAILREIKDGTRKPDDASPKERELEIMRACDDMTAPIYTPSPKIVIDPKRTPAQWMELTPFQRSLGRQMGWWK